MLTRRNRLAADIVLELEQRRLLAASTLSLGADSPFDSVAYDSETGQLTFDLSAPNSEVAKVDGLQINGSGQTLSLSQLGRQGGSRSVNIGQLDLSVPAQFVFTSDPNGGEVLFDLAYQPSVSASAPAAQPAPMAAVPTGQSPTQPAPPAVAQPTPSQQTPQTSGSNKPAIWIVSDATAITGYDAQKNEVKTDVNSDPDDQVALANYLLLSNRVDTRGIVLGSTNRDTNINPVESFNDNFRAAYAQDFEGLSKNIGGYADPDSIPVYEASTTAGKGFTTFSNNPSNYDDFDELPGTVQTLVGELQSDRYSASNPLYVLGWGPLTEPAMAVSYLQQTGDTDALENLFIVSHWHSSYTNVQDPNPLYSGEEAVRYGVANTNSDSAAAKFLREEAAKPSADFRWVDMASVGQTGIVNGYGNYFTGGNDGPVADQFRQSALGELFVDSKFAFGKPDGSDIATLYAVLGGYGVELSDYADNGQTTEQQELGAANAFQASAPQMLDELSSIIQSSQ